MIYLSVENSRTTMVGADQYILGVLDRELRYPTPIALANEADVVLPGYDGAWDGWSRLLRTPKVAPPWFPTGLLSHVLRHCEKHGYLTQVSDSRVKPDLDLPEISVKIPLRDYQREAADRSVEIGRGVVDCPPRSGKTRLMCEVVRRLALPTIWVAPTDRIVTQTQAVLEGWFGDNYSMHLVGASEDNVAQAVRRRVVVCTAATAVRLPVEFFQSRKCVICDEFHHCHSGGTKVLTMAGLQVIQDIQVGVLVWTGKQRWRKVLRVWKRVAPATMLRITTTAGVLEVTDGHQIYTGLNEKIQAGDLRVGSAVRVLEMWDGFSPQEGVQSASKMVLGSGVSPRFSEMPRVWKNSSQIQLRGAQGLLFHRRYIRKSRSTREGNENSVAESRVSQVSVRADERRQKPIKTPRGPEKDQRGMGEFNEGTLRPGGRRKGPGAYKVGEGSSRDSSSSGIRARVPGAYKAEEGRRGNLVSSGFCPTGSKSSRRNRREQSSEPPRSGRSQGCIFSQSRLDSVPYSSSLSGFRSEVVEGRVEKVEIIPSPGETVHDLEVEDDHSYFAEGVLVSNSAAPTYRNIFKNLDHVYYRYGMTGTFFRSGDDALAMHALLSTTIFKITSAELLREGYLVPSHVVFIPVLGPKLRGVDSSFHVGHGKYGIHEHVLRQQLAAHAALLLWKTGRKVLVLVGTKKQGHMLRKILLALLPSTPENAQFESVEFVSTDAKRKTQGEILKSFGESDEVKVLIGTSILGEGVDLPTADALVYAKGEKAEVTLTQNIYRTCTAVYGKRDAVVVDFADRHHRKLLRHSRERLRVYHSEPTFSVTALQDPRQFPGWLEHLTPGKRIGRDG